MIIKRLTTNNFFRFYGRHDFDFAHGKDLNITVIRGENGKGKTTILNAFYWCLYGDVTLPLYIEKIFNELAEHNLTDGESNTAFVEIVIEEKGHEYTLKRQRTFTRRGDAVVMFGDEDFSVFYKDMAGNPVPVLIKDKRHYFDRFIPQNLRGFFFFDGERIDRLAKVDGRAEIRQAILDILGLTTLDKLKEFFDRTKRDFNTEQKQFGSEDQRLLNEGYELLCSRRDKLIDEIDHLKDQQRTANENLAVTERFLETHNSEIVKSQQSLRKSLEMALLSIEKQIIEKQKAKVELVTKKFKNNLAAASYESAFEYLEAKRERGELPSDIKEQFIDDLLTKGECICGRPLSKDSPECLAVMAKKSQAGRNELDDAYHRLTAFIKVQRVEITAFYTTYHNINSELYDLQREKDERERQIKEIRDKLKNSNEEDIARNETLREQLKADIDGYKEAVIRAQIELEAQEKQITQKEAEIRRMEIKGEQAEAVKRRFDIAQQLAELNDKIRAYFIEITRTNLDKRIRNVFDTMKEKEYRYARLTKDFILEITNDLSDTDDNRILSTGEGQIASLAFIGSLVSYAREKLDDTLLSDFSGGDFPIVMDSPFGNLSGGHKANIAREIGNLATQVIVIVSDEQWSSVVEENISPRVGALYRMEDGTDDKQSVGEHTVVKKVK